MSTRAKVATRRDAVLEMADSFGWCVFPGQVPPFVTGYTSAPSFVAWRDGVQVVVVLRSADAARKPLSGPQRRWLAEFGGVVLELDTSPESWRTAFCWFSEGWRSSEGENVDESARGGPLRGGAS